MVVVFLYIAVGGSGGGGGGGGVMYSPQSAVHSSFLLRLDKNWRSSTLKHRLLMRLKRREKHQGARNTHDANE